MVAQFDACSSAVQEVMGSIHRSDKFHSLKLAVTEEILLNRLEGLSLPRKSVIGFTGRPTMTIAVYRDIKQ